MSVIYLSLDTPINTLRKYGFSYLTGEACGVAHRGLFDLDEKAKKVWETMTRTSLTSKCWNTGVGSIIIPNAWVKDIAVWCLLVTDKCHVVAEMVDKRGPLSLIGINNNTSNIEKVIQETYSSALKRGAVSISRYYKISSNPGTGLDNTHQMTQRTN